MSTPAAVSFRAVRKDFLPPLGLKALLTFRWRRERVRAIDRVDLDLEPGRIHAFVGPNGAGKTTLLKLVTGLLLPSEGNVVVQGRDTSRQPLAVRGRVGYCITEARSFFLRLSGRENLRFFASLHGLDGHGRTDRVDRILHELELPDVADRPVLSYSEGMKQRLALARSLLHEPEILLLDEIGRGLDPRLREKVFRLVADDLAGRRGTTVLMASHALDEVSALAHRVHVLREGRILASGDFEAVRPVIDEVFRGDT
jgi:ABC-2 type transport system ATP-binding protein